MKTPIEIVAKYGFGQLIGHGRPVQVAAVVLSCVAILMAVFDVFEREKVGSGSPKRRSETARVSQ